MLTHKAIKAYNVLDDSVKFIHKGEKVRIIPNPYTGSYHILQTESIGILSGWGIELTPVELKNYFVDISIDTL